MNLTQHFTLEEFEASSTASSYGIDNTAPRDVIIPLYFLAELLEDIREEIGKPILVTSGYRCPELNSVVGGSITSQHMFGEAADIKVKGMSAKDLFETIVYMPSFQRGDIDQCILEFNSWVHISTIRGDINREEFLVAKKDVLGNVIYEEYNDVWHRG